MSHAAPAKDMAVVEGQVARLRIAEGKGAAGCGKLLKQQWGAARTRGETDRASCGARCEGGE